MGRINCRSILSLEVEGDNENSGVLEGAISSIAEAKNEAIDRKEKKEFVGQW